MSWSPVFVAVLCTFWGPIPGQVINAQQQDIRRHDSQQPGFSDSQLLELISQLESDSHAERESASAQLFRAGNQAIAMLDSLKPFEHSEMKRRAEMLCEAIEHEQFQQLSETFLSRDGDVDPLQVPGWNFFRNSVGETRFTKQLYLEMLKSNRAMVQLFEQLDTLDPHSQEYLRAVDQLYQASTRLGDQLLVQLQNRTYKGTGDVVALLVSADALPKTTPPEVSQALVQARVLTYGAYLSKPAYRNVFRTLISKWLPKTHTSMAGDSMQLALMLDLPCILPTARVHLSDNFDPWLREWAFHCVARFGEEADIGRLIKHANDVTIVSQFEPTPNGIVVQQVAPPGVPIQRPHMAGSSDEYVVRICDLAIASAMTLLHQDPTSVFANFHVNTELAFESRSLACPISKSEQRLKAIEKWVSMHRDVIE